MGETIKQTKFPKGFLWGAATSSHQIEGNSENDWTDWEKKYGRSVSGVACDSWNRFNEDHKIIKRLGLNGYRFSIEWSRIEPTKGEFSIDAVRRYKSMLSSLQKKGITPMVTIWHWTLPKWLAEEGGILSADIAEHFQRYVRFLLTHLSEEVKLWITLNEPLVYTKESYFSGVRPPNRKNPLLSYMVAQKLINIHKIAYDEIKETSLDSSIGIAKSIVCFKPYKNRPHNRMIASLLNKIWNEYFLNKTIDHCDLIGVNFYTKAVVGVRGEMKNIECEDGMKWYYNPSSLYDALKIVKKYNKPVYITENGLSDGDDKYRAEYIKRAIKSVERALENDIDVRGYFHWSLLDNFEWESGYGPKFGLVEVDRDTQNRKIKDSAEEYSKIVRNHR